MHSLGANGGGNDGDSEAHALVDLAFHSGAKTQGRHGEQAGFEKRFHVFHIAMGDDVVAGQTTDRSWHLAADDMKDRVGQFAKNCPHYFGKKPEDGVLVWSVFESSDKKEAPARFKGWNRSADFVDV